jgi:hypothetical protein
MDPLEALGLSLGMSATSSADASVSAALVNNASINVGDVDGYEGATDLSGSANPTVDSAATATSTPTTTVSPSQSTSTAAAAGTAAQNLSTEAVLWASAAGILISVLLALRPSSS